MPKGRTSSLHDVPFKPSRRKVSFFDNSPRKTKSNSRPLSVANAEPWHLNMQFLTLISSRNSIVIPHKNFVLNENKPLRPLPSLFILLCQSLQFLFISLLLSISYHQILSIMLI